MFNPFYKNVLIINRTFEAYPGWHDMCVSVPVMKIENKDSQQNAAGHHAHDEVEISS